MYCNNCGKEIMSDDKFCPFCGSIIKKRITFNESATPDSIKKRAFILLDDENYAIAEEYFDSVLDVAPEDAEAYLGKLLAKMKLRSAKQMVEYYEDLYSDETWSKEKADISDLKDEYIQNKAKEAAVENYLSKERIEEIYHSFNNSFSSLTECRKKQKKLIKEEFENERQIDRIISLKDKKISKYFDDVISEYDRRIQKAQKDDKKAIKEIVASYPAHIEESDQIVEELHEQAINNREKDYQECVDWFGSEPDLNSCKQILSKLEIVGNYKEALEYKEKCENRIKELEAQEEASEIKRKQDAKKKTRAICIAGALLTVCLVIYQFVILPENKYNQAKSLFENGEYDEALSIFEELKDYKDATDMAVLTRYHQALIYLEKGEFEIAIPIFEESGELEDAPAKLNEAKYGYGNVLLERKEYDQAIAIFGSIGPYKDSEAMIHKAEYGKAISLREKKEYDEALSLFEKLGEFEDAKEQFRITEEEKLANSVKIPSLIGKTLEKAEDLLKDNDLIYTIKDSHEKNQKPGTVVSVSPDADTLVLKGTNVVLTIAKGSSEYSDYQGDRNTVVLFQVNVLNTGNNLRVRSAPTTADDNKIENAKAGKIFNVYEILDNEGYEWYRVGDKRWIANDRAWLYRDSICDQRHGSFEFYQATISNDEDISVYSNPVENTNQRSWLRSIPNGERVWIYYTFNNGTHTWYKVGAGEWIKDNGGNRVVR